MPSQHAIDASSVSCMYNSRLKQNYHYLPPHYHVFMLTGVCILDLHFSVSFSFNISCFSIPLSLWHDYRGMLSSFMSYEWCDTHSILHYSRDIYIYIYIRSALSAWVPIEINCKVFQTPPLEDREHINILRLEYLHPFTSRRSTWDVIVTTWWKASML